MANIVPDDFRAPLVLASSQEPFNFGAWLVAVTVIVIGFHGDQVNVSTDPVAAGFVVRIQIKNDADTLTPLRFEFHEVNRAELIYDTGTPGSR